MSEAKKPGSKKPARKDCYRDPKTGKFICKPGSKPSGKPAAKPTGKPQPKKPPKGWFPMPDQRQDFQGRIASSSRKPKPNRTA